MRLKAAKITQEKRIKMAKNKKNNKVGVRGKKGLKIPLKNQN